jgi:hypothetical protein
VAVRTALRISSEEQTRRGECVVAGDLEAWKEATGLLHAEREWYADVAALVDAAWKCYRWQSGYMLISTSSQDQKGCPDED